MFSILGAIGNLFFGFKSGFQVWKNYKTKTFECSIMMILFDFVGNICCGAYIAGTTGFWTLPWQFVNYTLATIFIVVLLIQYFLYKDNTRGFQEDVGYKWKELAPQDSYQNFAPIYGCQIPNDGNNVTLEYRLEKFDKNWDKEIIISREELLKKTKELSKEFEKEN